jgi:hypothetical protein
MKGSRTNRTAVIALVAGATALWMVPANASTGAASISGSGTIAPGLTTSGPSPQSWALSASGVIVADGVPGLFVCDIDGTDTIGTVQQGTGSFAANCTSTTCGKVVASGVFNRNGNAITASGTLAGCVSGQLTAGCTFVPSTTTPRVTSFQSTCNVVFK